MNVALYEKRDSTDIIKLRIFRWEDYPGLSGWALRAINHKYPYNKETQRRQKVMYP